MYIARILYPVKVLGPGNRIGIWFDGCNHKCKGCSNPELWEFKEKYKTDLSVVMNLINRIVSEYPIDGFTITGGDPFFQPASLFILVKELSKIHDDILIYTGYDYEYIENKYGHIVEYSSVIIDGLYIENRNNNSVLKGSDNQRIIITNSKYVEMYEIYINNTKNEIQNFTLRDGVISVGIHRPHYEDDLKKILLRKGLK